MSTPATVHRRRVASTAAVGLVAAMSLTSCFGMGMGGGGSAAVSDVQQVKNATMLFGGQGTFIAPGTLYPSETAWIGTGWFITPDGYAVTNNHVVTGAGTLKVRIAGDPTQEYSAQVVSASECYDLAVVKVDTTQPMPFLSWYDGDITEGIEVYSAGYPAVLGAQYTLTKGIVSQADTKIATSWTDVEHALEHDARIRGGNSGGPLISTGAQVLGVNYAGDDESDSNYAIQRASARDVIAKLKNGEQLLTLGINAQANMPDETGRPQGIWVASVKAGGPADLAGIKPGDVIDKLGGVTMGDRGAISGYCDVLRTHGIENAIDVEVWRPMTGDILEGQVNGKPLAVVGNTGSAGGSGGSSGGDTPNVTGGYTAIFNDDSTIIVDVPDTWSDIDGEGFTDADGISWKYLAAAPKLSGFQDTWDTPGMVITATTKGTVQPKTVIDEMGQSFASDCTSDTLAANLADGYATGYYSIFTNCGGVGTTIFIASGEIDGGSSVFRMVVQLTKNDNQDIIQQIMNTYWVSL